MKKTIKNITYIIVIILFFLFFIQIVSENGKNHKPYVGKANIESIVRDGVNEKEYSVLQQQTGLAECVIKDILKNDNAKEILNKFQNQNFREYKILCEYICFPVTKTESLKDNEGNPVFLDIPKLRNGDILITKSTHTLVFRHGHAGLVTNAETGEILEAMVLGSNSKYSNIDSWKNYSSLAILRPKNLSDDEIDKVIDFARTKLFDVEYDLTAGMFGDVFDKEKEVKKTHCSHLVWYSYMSAGVDIDANGGEIVLPDDILKSDNLEIIWSYGINATK